MTSKNKRAQIGSVRDMLEMAAAAAGIVKLVYDETFGLFGYYVDGDHWHRWDSLDDSGDALELASALNLKLNIGAQSIAIAGPKGWPVRIKYAEHADKNTAIRYAITRMAAVIFLESQP